MVTLCHCDDPFTHGHTDSYTHTAVPTTADRFNADPHAHRYAGNDPDTYLHGNADSNANVYAAVFRKT